MARSTLLTIICMVILSLTVNAIPTISVTGSKFFTSDGKQFYVKGVAYQLIEDDPLANAEQCQRDAQLMQKLGANSIRVYHVNATADHSGCMNAFAAVGIYAWIDLDSFKTYIRLAGQASWTQDKSDSFRAVMDNFQQFDNTAGFFVGNEVLNDQADASAAPYLLTAKRDLSEYAKSKGYRNIPIGYSATDTGALPMLADYLVCRPDPTERLDFYSLNSYRWCGQSSFEQSGYVFILNATATYPVPIFFSEVGCNTQGARDFGDQNAVFNQMADVWSGSIIYEWIQETNHYGLVSYGPQQDASINDGNNVVQGFTRAGVPTPVQPDFANLQAQWATLKPTGVEQKAYAATAKTTAPVCPKSTAGAWSIDPSAALPTKGAAVGASGTNTASSVSIPSGKITVASTSLAGSATAVGNPSGVPNPPTTSGSIPNLPHTGSSSTTVSGSGSGPTSSASPQQAGASPSTSLPTFFTTSHFSSALLALGVVSFSAMVFL